MAGSDQRGSLDPSDIQLGKEIGHGSSGKVVQAIWTRPGGQELKVAAKFITDLEKNDEILFLSQLRHTNIVSYYGFYKEMTSLAMITELAKSDLKTRLDNSSYPLQQSIIEKWVNEAIYGLQYLHERGVVHCDIKTANYLLMEDETLKLADFGIAKKLDETLSTISKGTHRWMAPEVFIDLKRSKRSDVYSFGMVVWSICTTKTPFHSLSDYKIMQDVKNKVRPTIPTECHLRFRRVIEGCWHPEYKQRPSMDKVLQYLKLEEDDHAILLGPRQGEETEVPMDTSENQTEKQSEVASSAVSADSVASFFSRKADKRRQRKKQTETSADS